MNKTIDLLDRYKLLLAQKDTKIAQLKVTLAHTQMQLVKYQLAEKYGTTSELIEQFLSENIGAETAPVDF